MAQAVKSPVSHRRGRGAGLGQAMYIYMVDEVALGQGFLRVLPIFPRQYDSTSRSRWPRGLRHGPTTARLLGLRVWIMPGTWMSVSCECCVLSGRGLCDGLIARPEETYRIWCVWVWSRNHNSEEAVAHEGCRGMKKKYHSTSASYSSSSACHSYQKDKRATTGSVSKKHCSFRNRGALYRGVPYFDILYFGVHVFRSNLFSPSSERSRSEKTAAQYCEISDSHGRDNED
jgi:hypothetical protein